MSVVTMPVVPPATAARATSANPSAPPDDFFYRLSVRQYHGMVTRGILQPGTPVELLEGLLVETMPISPEHALGVKLGRRALERIVPDGSGWHVATENPVTTADSESEPDLAVLRGDPVDYQAHHPSPQDAGLLVEVAHSSLDRDRGLKLRVYARAGVRAYWIVNLADRVVEVHADPRPSPDPASYGRVERFAPGQEIPLVLDGREVGRVPVASLFPPPRP